MPPATLEEIRAGIYSLFSDLTDVNVYKYWPNNLQTPALIIVPGRRPRDEVFNDDEPLRYWRMEALSNPNDNIQAQMIIDQYLDETGPKSIKVRLESDPTLGGAVANSEFIGWSDYGGRRTEATAFIGGIVEFSTNG